MTQRWLPQALADRCATERQALASRSATTLREADLYRPGHEKNRDLSAHGWAVYYVTLRLSIAQLDAELKPKEREAAHSAALLLAALTDAPAPIDSFALIHVYPKSIGALAFIGKLGNRLNSLEKEERQSLYEIIAWCATYASPTLPFADTDSIPPSPLYVRVLGLERLQRIFTALCLFHEDRIAFLHSINPIEALPDRAYAAQPSSGRDSQMAQMVDQLSEQLERPAETLTRDWSLPSLVALAVVASSMDRSPPDRGGALVA